MTFSGALSSSGMSLDINSARLLLELEEEDEDEALALEDDDEELEEDEETLQDGDIVSIQ